MSGFSDNVIASTGFTHFGARYYASGVQRWTQRDPVNQPNDTPGWNRYFFAGDDPVNYRDPSGRQCSAGAAPGAAFGLAGGAESIEWGVETRNFILGGAAVEAGATALGSEQG